MLEFRILGPLEVIRDNGPLELGGLKQRALLAALVIHAGHVVSTERLVDELWGENPPATATSSLQNYVSQLRKLLGTDVVVTRPPGYLLRASSEQVDAFRFERLVAESREQGPEQRASILRRALALWRGPPLADFSYEAFAENEIGRLEELRSVALEGRIDADLELGRHAELVGELEGLVAANPLRERLREQLMLALYRSGRQAEALQAYQAARRTLVDELGIDPSPSLQRLHASILRHEAGLEPAGSGGAPRDELRSIADVLLAGRLVPVLGSEVAELTSHLASRFDYPREDASDLPRVSQYVAVMNGSGPLYDALHELFERSASPTPVHRFFASLPPLLRERGAQHQLIVTTSYELALEQAFVDAGEEFDVVAYVASGRNRGKFCHARPDGSAALIDVPNTYATELSLEQRTVILKIHGQVDRTAAREWESFVVTEDDYIDYLAESELASVVPVSLVATLRRSHFLFLGYRMRDWNLRVLLNRLWGEQKVSYRSWAVQPAPRPVERAFWRQRDVRLVDAELEAYIGALRSHLDALVPAEAGG